MERRKTFARFTEDHDDIALELTPCAGFLYRWLLRTAPAGVPQEIELEAFRQKTNYSLKWIQSALNELIESDLVEKDSGHSHHPQLRNQPNVPNPDGHRCPNDRSSFITTTDGNGDREHGSNDRTNSLYTSN